MSLLSKLFGARPNAKAETETETSQPEEYKGFAITPCPIREGSRYRVSARIEKGDRVHRLIRADMLDDAQTATATSLAKAKRMIDEQGERLFG